MIFDFMLNKISAANLPHDVHQVIEVKERG
jgi:hypothetical protein